MVKYTLPEAELIKQMDNMRRSSELMREAGKKAASKPGSAQPVIDIRYIRPEGATKMCELDQNLRPCFPGQWVDDLEYDRRFKSYRDNVLPKPAGRPHHVITGLQEDGSVCAFWALRSEISSKEYFKRYRKWRRHWRLSDRRVKADLPYIMEVTGWKPGFDHWFLRLLRFGPRPQ